MSMLPMILDCQGCGACCQTMNVPPFRIDAGCNEPAQRNVPEPLIEELRIAWEVRLRLPPGPCSWLDESTLRCRHYALRPQACRDFELGGAACLATRAAAGRDAKEEPAT